MRLSKKEYVEMITDINTLREWASSAARAASTMMEILDDVQKKVTATRMPKNSRKTFRKEV